MAADNITQFPVVILSPHDDDVHLFCCFTAMREHASTIICFDSYIQPARGEIGCSAADRAEESENAHRVVGGSVSRLGIPDNAIDEGVLLRKLQSLSDKIGAVYAPALQGGSPHHDLVSRTAAQAFGSRVRYYTTYTKDELYTTGDIEVIPTQDELALKKEAMDCYESQHRINLGHFRAVLGKSEWLMGAPLKVLDRKLHLGCGMDRREGWINLDRIAGADVVCDVTTERLPFDDSSIDYVYSQDFLEHLPAEFAVPVMNEIWRVLKPDGIMEHYVPNAGSRNDFGSPSHLSHWNLQVFEHFDVDNHRWLKDRHYEGFAGGFKKVLAELVNWQVEEDGISRAQSIHVQYRAAKPC